MIKIEKHEEFVDGSNPRPGDFVVRYIRDHEDEIEKSDISKIKAEIERVLGENK